MSKPSGQMEAGYGRREPIYNKENQFGSYQNSQYDEEVATG
jgi:hypothetical protein